MNPTLLALSLLAPQQIDTARALDALRDASSLCAADSTALWGKSLCGPIALVDRRTRLVLANDTTAGVPYLPYSSARVSVLPANQFIANTSFRWGGRPWTMVTLPLPADRYDRVRLVMHEVMHREQESLGLRASDPLNNHLDFRDGRTWLRLELNALARALTTVGDQRSRVIHDALLFRAMRRSLYPASDTLEALLELQEGVPEYTGTLFAMRAANESPTRVARDLEGFVKSRPTLVRSFAYGTGPALGLLLDQLTPRWRTQLRTRRDMGGMLAEAAGFKTPANLASVARERAKVYGWDEIDRDERARDSIRAPMLRSYRERFVDGRTITLTQPKDSLNWGFDPNSLVAFDLTHAVYPFGSFSAPWGSLNVSENGVLVSNDLAVIRVGVEQMPLDTTSREIKGIGWTLTINPGWTIVTDKRKNGSFMLSPIAARPRPN